ncbi:MAG: alpha/beta hydrolase [Clostridia bacterium]|nr:alpha/beta hydrolase [Clostridia bacterium]
MKYIYKGYQIDYDYIKSGEMCIVYLHGWLGNKNSFAKVRRFLQNYSSLSISLPPYLNKESIMPLNMYDYRDIVLQILSLHSITNPIIVCHSFGCRIALMLSSEIPIKKLVITGGAGIKPRRPFWRKWNNGKKALDKRILGFENVVGSPDYVMLKKIDKQTFKNIVNLDLRHTCKYVDCPTLLYWGKRDKETPMYMCRYMAKHMTNAKVKIVDGGHFAYQEYEQDFMFSVKKFLEN